MKKNKKVKFNEELIRENIVTKDGKIKAYDFSRFEKEMLGKDEIYISEAESARENKRHLGEMSNLVKKLSKLPANLWLDDDGTWMTTKHKIIRLKFQGDRQNLINKSNMIPMSISDNPQILVKNPKKLELDKSEIDLIKKFVKVNKDLLVKLQNQEINFGDFLKKMKKVK